MSDEAVLDAFLAPWVGSACRHIPEPSSRGILDFRFAGLSRKNRWNEPGQPTLYLASDHGVALAEFARHVEANIGGEIGKDATVRRNYDLRVAVDRALDLRDPRLLAALGVGGAPACFLDRSLARATAGYLRRTTAAQAVVVPSVAFLDDPTCWVLLLFLDKLPADPARFLTDVRPDGTFRLDP